MTSPYRLYKEAHVRDQAGAQDRDQDRAQDDPLKLSPMAKLFGLMGSTSMGLGVLHTYEKARQAADLSGFSQGGAGDPTISRKVIRTLKQLVEPGLIQHPAGVRIETTPDVTGGIYYGIRKDRTVAQQAMIQINPRAHAETLAHELGHAMGHRPAWLSEINRLDQLRVGDLSHRLPAVVKHVRLRTPYTMGLIGAADLANRTNVLSDQQKQIANVMLPAAATLPFLGRFIEEARANCNALSLLSHTGGLRQGVPRLAANLSTYAIAPLALGAGVGLYGEWMRRHPEFHYKQAAKKDYEVDEQGHCVYLIPHKPDLAEALSALKPGAQARLEQSMGVRFEKQAFEPTPVYMPPPLMTKLKRNLKLEEMLSKAFGVYFTNVKRQR